MISQKLNELKKKLNHHKIDGYIIPKNDEYFSEFAQKDNSYSLELKQNHMIQKNCL